MALSPQERTWAQMQENLRRKRQAGHQDQLGRPYNRYRKAPPVPLPRLPDSPTDAPLRGSHYPVIPPVANDDGYIMYMSTPYPHNGATTGGHHREPLATRPPWNSSVRVGGERRPFLQSGGDFPSSFSHLPGRHHFDDGGQTRKGPRRRRGPRGGRHVWRDPRDEARLEEESATVVQRHYRGYRTRKSLQQLCHLQDPGFAVGFMHHFLTDVLQNDLILDVASEVLVEERVRKKQPRETRQSKVDRLIVNFTPTRDQRFWEEALNRPDIHKPVAASLILEVLHEETRVVLAEGIDELLTDYFETKVLADMTKMVVTDVLVEMIPDMIEESTQEVVLETVAEELIDAETEACVSSFMQEALLRGSIPLVAAEEKAEIKEVDRVAKNVLLDAIFLDHLLSTVVRNGQVWSYLEEADRFLDDQLLEILLGQYTGTLHRRRATEECVPLKRLHERIVTDVALDTIIYELSDQLEEDLEDLDEYERS